MTVFVECYPDAMLLRVLGVPRKQLSHQRCKGEIVKRLLKFDCVIGLVDEDPGSSQPRDMDNYKQVQADEGLRLLARRDNSNRRLIVVCPKLEDWLIARARSSGIRPGDFSLPSDPDRLHAIPRYEQKEGFGRFLAELKEQDSGVQLLRRWLVGQT